MTVNLLSWSLGVTVGGIILMLTGLVIEWWGRRLALGDRVIQTGMAFTTLGLVSGLVATVWAMLS